MEANELLRIKNKIESGKQKLSELKGKKDTYMESLKTSYQCENLKDVEKKIDTLENEVSILNQEINQSVQTLESEHPDLFD